MSADVYLLLHQNTHDDSKKEEENSNEKRVDLINDSHAVLKSVPRTLKLTNQVSKFLIISIATLLILLIPLISLSPWDSVSQAQYLQSQLVQMNLLAVNLYSTSYYIREAMLSQMVGSFDASQIAQARTVSKKVKDSGAALVNGYYGTGNIFPFSNIENYI